MRQVPRTCPRCSAEIASIETSMGPALVERLPLFYTQFEQERGVGAIITTSGRIIRPPKVGRDFGYIQHKYYCGAGASKTGELAATEKVLQLFAAGEVVRVLSEKPFNGAIYDVLGEDLVEGRWIPKYIVIPVTKSGEPDGRIVLAVKKELKMKLKYSFLQTQLQATNEA